MSGLNLFAMVLGYCLIVPTALFAVLCLFGWAFQWISYFAIEAHYQIKQRRGG